MKATVVNLNNVVEYKRNFIVELTITGEFVSKRDCPEIRKMCNPNFGGQLAYLDLSQCDLFYEFRGGWKCNGGDLDSDGFKDCITLKKISLPFDISVDAEDFSGCKNLEEIYIPFTVDKNKYKLGERNICHFSKTQDGVLFIEYCNERTHECVETKLVKFPAKKGTEYTIPSNVTHIGKYAFEDCQLTKLIMPKIAPICDNEAFFNVDFNSLTLVVPKGCRDNYWLHPIFGMFKIEEME